MLVCYPENGIHAYEIPRIHRHAPVHGVAREIGGIDPTPAGQVAQTKIEALIVDDIRPRTRNAYGTWSTRRREFARVAHVVVNTGGARRSACNQTQNSRE